MHQQSRHPPRGAFSPATAPQTNPTRTNNPRDAPSSRSRATSEATPSAPLPDAAGDAASPGAGGFSSSTAIVGGPTPDSIKKLDQIIQNFYLKAAVLVVQSRIPVTPSGAGRGRKTNKWFQIETDDIDDFKDELKIWKHCGGFDHRPPPMIIETYLDASRLSPGQALVVIDENGKRWDALEALNSSDLSGSGSSSSGRSDNNNNSNKIRTRTTEIILERWKVELRCIPSLVKTSAGGTGSGSGPTADAGGLGPGERGRASEGGSGASSVEYEIEDFGPILPTIYKRSIVFFRSLFVTTNVLPACRFSRQATTKNIHPALKVRCRVLTGAQAEARINARGFDNLRQPLLFDGAREAVTDYMFGDLEVPIGRFSASVTYRNDCSFRVDDSESLLSSRFMGIDENYFRPSIPQTQRPDTGYLAQQRHAVQQQQQLQQHGGQQHRRQSSVNEAPVGSLPSRHHRHVRTATEPSNRLLPQQTYGSLSTFHGTDPLATSPISALKAVRPIGSDTSSPTESINPSSMEQRPQFEPPHSLPITAGRHTGMSPTSSSIVARATTLRNLDGIGRRPSVTFQPFKAGSLSSSPRVHDDLPVSSSPRPTPGLSALAQARSRNSLTAGMAASLRAAPVPSSSAGSAVMGGAITMDPGLGSSPRLSGGASGGSRYSSSFTHRRGRLSFGGTSRNDDDQGSSGKQSLASSMAQPGSGLLAEAGGVASSGSFQTDDDNISEFLKTLESKKTLQSFEVSSKRGDSARRTVAQLSRFQTMRESNAALMDSMNASMSPSPSPSQQLSSRSLGAQLPSNTSISLSPSSHSPIRSPHTPHTQHTPAVPSKLSENEIADDQGPAHTRPRPSGSRAIEEGDESDGDRARGTTAIDIPLSPRLHHQPGGGGRRSSSAVQKKRAQLDDDSADLAAFGPSQRSVSVGADDREPLSPGALFRLEGPDSSSGDASGVGDSSSSAVGGAGGSGAGVVATSPGHVLGTAGGLKAAAAGILRPSSGGAVPRSSGLGINDSKAAITRVGSLPPNALAATSAALRASAGAGISASALIGSAQRKRYTGRQQQQQPQSGAADTVGGRGGPASSDGRPTPPHMSRGSFSGSFMGRYSGSGRGGSGAGSLTGGGPGASGDDDDLLLFDLSEIGRDPSRRSIDEARGGGSHDWRQQ